jgi:hypothetical protein
MKNHCYMVIFLVLNVCLMKVEFKNKMMKNKGQIINLFIYKFCENNF